MLKTQSSLFYHVRDWGQIGVVHWCCSQWLRINFCVSLHFALSSVFKSFIFVSIPRSSTILHSLFCSIFVHSCFSLKFTFCCASNWCHSAFWQFPSFCGFFFMLFPASCFFLAVVFTQDMVVKEEQVNKKWWRLIVGLSYISLIQLTPNWIYPSPKCSYFFPLMEGTCVRCILSFLLQKLSQIMLSQTASQRCKDQTWWLKWKSFERKWIPVTEKYWTGWGLWMPCPVLDHINWGWQFLGHLKNVFLFTLV